MSQPQEVFQSSPSEIRVLEGGENTFCITVFHKTKTYLLFHSISPQLVMAFFPKEEKTCFLTTALNGYSDKP